MSGVLLARNDPDLETNAGLTGCRGLLTLDGQYRSCRKALRTLNPSSHRSRTVRGDLLFGEIAC